MTLAWAVGAAACAPAWAADLLPDMIVNTARFNDYIFSKNIIPGRVHIRFSNGTPNIGLGPMFIHPGAPVGRTQPVVQRIFLSQGGFRDREAGIFVYHPSHNHFHFGGWSQYYIRAVLPGDGIGPILREGDKTSFCLLDSARYFGPGSVPAGSQQFTGCGNGVQGVSVGWEDVYSRTLPDQWIDITGLTPGEYWLEAVVDPRDQIEEINENNNVGRIKLNILPGQLPVPDEIPVGRGLFFSLGLVLVLATVGILALRAGLGGKSKP
jgi:hypothetical protein